MGRKSEKGEGGGEEIEGEGRERGRGKGERESALHEEIDKLTGSDQMKSEYS